MEGDIKHLHTSIEFQKCSWHWEKEQKRLDLKIKETAVNDEERKQLRKQFIWSIKIGEIVESKWRVGLGVRDGQNEKDDQGHLKK